MILTPFAKGFFFFLQNENNPELIELKNWEVKQRKERKGETQNRTKANLRREERR